MAYKQALESAARIEEIIAAHLTMLANESAQQDQPEVADMLQQASHQHRAHGMMNRALMTVLNP
jgi:hypothetical protein